MTFKGIPKFNFYTSIVYTAFRKKIHETKFHTEFRWRRNICNRSHVIRRQCHHRRRRRRTYSKENWTARGTATDYSSDVGASWQG